MLKAQENATLIKRRVSRNCSRPRGAPDFQMSKYRERGKNKCRHFHWLSCVCGRPHNTFQYLLPVYVICQNIPQRKVLWGPLAL